MALVFPLHPWTDIRHYGRAGADRGVDIHATERTEDGLTRTWFVQCRRYQRANKATLTGAVDDAVARSKTLPQVLLVVVACDVSRVAHEHCVDYAGRKGISTTLIWTASVLEAMLRSTRRELLFSYFGLSIAEEAREREYQVSRNIDLKKRLNRDLRAPIDNIDLKRLRSGESHRKFASSAAIIHNVDDDTYPEVDTRKAGIGGWFKLEFWNFHHAGIEFIIDMQYAIRDRQGRWTLLEHDQQFDATIYERIKLWKIARIPYRNIVDYEVDGDEYYPHPHLYCRFADAGMPYDGFRFAVAAEGQYPYPMDPALQFQGVPKALTKKRGRR